MPFLTSEEISNNNSKAQNRKMSLSVMRLYSRSMMSLNSLDGRGPPNVMPDDPVPLRLRPDGKPYYEKDKSTSDIARVFQWDVKEDEVLPLDTAARKRIRQKNFISLNKDEVRRIESKLKDAQKNARENLKEELAKPLWKSDKLNGLYSRAVKDASPLSVQNGHRRHYLEKPIAKLPERRSRRQLKNDQSKHVPNGHLPAEISEEEPLTPRSKSVEPAAAASRQNSAAGKKENKSFIQNNHVQTNAQAARKAFIKRAPSATALDEVKKKTDAALKNHPRGQLPEYLKERRKAWQIANEPPKNYEAPPGHILMNADEKNRTLASLKRAEADLLKRYNSLPVRTDTEFLKRKKQVLLRQLGEVDEAIKIFSRPNVYIKTDPY